MTEEGKRTQRVLDAGVDRYKHDVAHAHAIKKRQEPQQNNVTELKQPMRTADNVKLALRGLDEAERRQEEGDLQSAMTIYELSIEMLLKYLRKPRSKSPHSAGRHEKVATRVRLALSQAEELKSRIRLESEIQSPSSTSPRDRALDTGNSPQQSDAEQSSWSDLSASLISLLFPSSPTKSPENVTIDLTGDTVGEGQKTGTTTAKSKSNRGLFPARRSSRRASPKNEIPTAQSAQSWEASLRASSSPDTSSPSKESVPYVSESRGRLPHTTAQINNRGPKTASSTQQANSRRRSMDYDKDPLVQTIKNDLYVPPSNLTTTWDDIAGLRNAKQALQEAAILPLLRPDLYTGLRTAPKGILLYGPPGTGKTMLVKAVANESDCLLFSCTASALTSKWHGEGEKLVRTLFRMARDVAPSIIFLDEMDALLSSRSENEHEASRRFKTEFMIQMDGITKDTKSGDPNAPAKPGVLILGATNCPWDVDDAVMRRFQRRIYVPLPDKDARSALFQHLLKKTSHSLTGRQITQLVQWTNGFSCSDISSLASDAAFGPLRALGGISAIRDVKSQDVRPVSLKDFSEALQSAHSGKSVSPELLEKYHTWEQRQQQS